MSVSLNAVGSALGKSGAVTLSDTVENGYTRTHAGSGYRRINPFQAESGNAPSELTAPHTLGDWVAYSHSSVNSGSALAVTRGYMEISVSWSKPAGYSRAPSILTQKVYWKDMGTSEDLSVNPFNLPTGTADVGDVTSYDITSALTAGHYYAVGVKVEFDDSVDSHTNADSLGYDSAMGETGLLGGGRGVSSGKVYDDAPTIDSVVQDTDPGSCLVGCTNCVDITINVTMEGSSQGTLQEQVDGGGWTTIDSGVPAGSASLSRTNLDAGVSYDYRLKYNDVAGSKWSNVGSITTECTLV